MGRDGGAFYPIITDAILQVVSPPHYYSALSLSIVISPSA